MKKIFALIAASILSLSASHAQEAFKHLGASVEFGTTGLGVNLSYPLVSDHLVLTVGYNFPKLTLKSNFDLNVAPINDRIGQANKIIGDYNKIMDDFGNFLPSSMPRHIDELETLSECNTKIKDQLVFGNFKAMLEYYPTTKSFFHITAGIFVGNGEWMNISAQADEQMWGLYTKAIELNRQIPDLRGQKELIERIPAIANIHPVEGLEDAAKIRINDDTYHLSPSSGGRLDTKLTIKKVKPYIGIGFGSSVPTEKRMGFQMEIGAYYQGKPTFESDAMTEYDSKAFSNKMVDEIVDNLVFLSWYPQLTFRFTGRIF